MVCVDVDVDVYVDVYVDVCEGDMWCHGRSPILPDSSQIKIQCFWHDPQGSSVSVEVFPNS